MPACHKSAQRNPKKKFPFQRNKYGHELLIDCGQMSQLKGFTLDQTPFWIEFHELFFVTSGEGVFKLNEERIPFQKGTVLLLPPNKWRQWESITGKLDGYTIFFEEEFISKFFHDGLFLYRFHYFYNNASPSYIQLNDQELSTYLSLLLNVRKELDSLQHDSNHFLRAILYQLLINLNRTYSHQFNIKEEFFGDNLSLQFRRLLEQEVRNNRDVSFYAEKLEVSRSHLTKTLKKTLGKPPAQLIRNRLIVEAKKELLFSKFNISEISHQLHFSEPSNFNRLFKELTGMSPNEFRMQNSN
ncbi:MAG: AraC family transcriptional regulator [Bacteroidota bacterium]